MQSIFAVPVFSLPLSLHQPGEEIPSSPDGKEGEEEGQGVGHKREEEEAPVSTTYRLRGIVVHSGQASGGHYYSFIHMK